VGTTGSNSNPLINTYTGGFKTQPTYFLAGPNGVNASSFGGAGGTGGNTLAGDEYSNLLGTIPGFQGAGSGQGGSGGTSATVGTVGFDGTLGRGGGGGGGGGGGNQASGLGGVGGVGGQGSAGGVILVCVPA
jgi:hypothetical protein